ncbi:MAG: dioxygenase family protein [Nocardioides sp.]
MTAPPVLFLSHGAPPLADDALWTRQLADWSSALADPSSILMVSAHWESAPITLSSTTGAPLLYDFWGFPQRYYEVTYAAPPAPALATATERLLKDGGLTTARDEGRGLDHGGYVPLVEMYPQADVPVVQLSLPTLEPTALFQVGRLLAPLRDEGTLIVGSGFTTHNLAWFRPSNPSDGPAPSPSAEFDQWAAEAMDAQDVDGLLDFAHQAPAATVAHPRTEHWAPLYVALGAAYAGGSVPNRSVIDGFWYGLSKRSWEIG